MIEFQSLPLICQETHVQTVPCSEECHAIDLWINHKATNRTTEVKYIAFNKRVKHAQLPNIKERNQV